MLAVLLMLEVVPLSSASAAPRPESWPVIFSETFRLETGEMRQSPLTWDGIQARRFYLRLTATHHFDTTITRVKDGSILFHGRLEPRYGVLIPWGRDEYAHLTLWSRSDEALQIHMSLATDPEEDGLEIYSLHLNRFLALYEAGDLTEAERALSKALAEDPQDEVAQVLWSRLWEERGVGSGPAPSPSVADPDRLQYAEQERQELLLLEARVEAALSVADPDSARRVLERAPRFTDDRARAGAWILEARISVADSDFGSATGILQAALPQTGDERARFDLQPRGSE